MSPARAGFSHWDRLSQSQSSSKSQPLLGSIASIVALATSLSALFWAHHDSPQADFLFNNLQDCRASA